MRSSTLLLLMLCFSFAFGQNRLDNAENIVSINTDINTDSVSSQANELETPIHDDFHIKYNLEQPDTSFDLPSELKEISGLSFDNSFEKLYAVQDENGLVFIIDKQSGNVEETIEFHKDGDYEGIEVIGDKVYVVKSTGTVYEIKNLGQEDQKMEKYNLFLSRENDVEGFCYDPSKNVLLMACKGVPASGESFEVIRYKKVVYGFDVNTHEIDSVPIYNVQLDGIQKCIHTSSGIKNTEELKACFSYDEKDMNFNPSGIAIHPHTQHVYMLSSAGKTMIVLNYEGEIIYVERLNKKVHKQPEGIAFDKDGTLYISNEGGKEKPAKIHRFSYKK